MAREIQVTFDCADPAGQAAFWAEALGYVLDEPPAGFATWEEALDAWHVPADQRNSASAVHDPDGTGPRLFFQQVPEGKVAKDRQHLDVRAATGLSGEDRMAALETECDRLVALGASRQQRFEPGGMSSGHIVMLDPEGHEFCLD
ncbi:VOC family protein [soil metagenome]